MTEKNPPLFYPFRGITAEPATAITLRDLFALAAMNAIVQPVASAIYCGESPWNFNLENIAADAYRTADVMLAERMKVEEKQ